MYPGQHPPKFAWLKITGVAGVDDFGIASDCRLIVSEKALLVLQPHRLDHCEVEEYGPSASETPPTAPAVTGPARSWLARVFRQGDGRRR
jgi:hypothetical protein